MPQHTSEARRGIPDDRLARLLDSPSLARVVPQVAPELLHQLIRSRGLDAFSEIVAYATPEQLTAIFDLDLWRPAEPGQDERFDADRFADWLDLLVEAGDSVSVRILADMDIHLAVAGLSRHVRVFDLGSLEPTAQSDDEAMESGIGRADLTCELGGYLVVARRTDAWDAIMTLLLALDTEHPSRFHAVMEGCRRLSNSAPEIDGLDDLLEAPEQHLHDVTIGREQRLSQLGYCTPGDARAFLEMARSGRRDRTVAPGPPHPTVRPSPLALVQSETSAPRLAHLRSFMARVRDTDEAAFLERNQELAFLANALVAGSMLQSDPFTPRDASEAAAAICNLGLELADAPAPDLVAAFEAGWSTLYREVCAYSARRLMETLGELHCLDPTVQSDLQALRIELRKQCEAGAPWRARDALDVMATLDMVVWTALLGLFSECPVIPDALTAILEGRKGAVSATKFEFISTTAQIDLVRTFMARLPELL